MGTFCSVHTVWTLIVSTTESLSGISRGDVYFEVQCHVGQEANLETLGCAWRGMAVVISCTSLTGLVPFLLSHSTGKGMGM